MNLFFTNAQYLYVYLDETFKPLEEAYEKCMIPRTI